MNAIKELEHTGVIETTAIVDCIHVNITPTVYISKNYDGYGYIEWIELEDEDEIDRLDIRFGDEVLIRQKPNEKPEIIQVLLDKPRGKKFSKCFSAT